MRRYKGKRMEMKQEKGKVIRKKEKIAEGQKNEEGIRLTKEKFRERHNVRRETYKARVV